MDKTAETQGRNLLTKSAIYHTIIVQRVLLLVYREKYKYIFVNTEYSYMVGYET